MIEDPECSDAWNRFSFEFDNLYDPTFIQQRLASNSRVTKIEADYQSMLAEVLEEEKRRLVEQRNLLDKRAQEVDGATYASVEHLWQRAQAFKNSSLFELQREELQQRWRNILKSGKLSSKGQRQSAKSKDREPPKPSTTEAADIQSLLVLSALETYVVKLNSSTQASPAQVQKLLCEIANLADDFISEQKNKQDPALDAQFTRLTNAYFDSFLKIKSSIRRVDVRHLALGLLKLCMYPQNLQLSSRVIEFFISSGLYLEMNPNELVELQVPSPSRINESIGFEEHPIRLPSDLENLRHVVVTENALHVRDNEVIFRYKRYPSSQGYFDYSRNTNNSSSTYHYLQFKGEVFYYRESSYIESAGFSCNYEGYSNKNFNFDTQPREKYPDYEFERIASVDDKICFILKRKNDKYAFLRYDKSSQQPAVDKELDIKLTNDFYCLGGIDDILLVSDQNKRLVIIKSSTAEILEDITCKHQFYGFDANNRQLLAIDKEKSKVMWLPFDFVVSKEILAKYFEPNHYRTGSSMFRKEDATFDELKYTPPPPSQTGDMTLTSSNCTKFKAITRMILALNATSRYLTLNPEDLLAQKDSLLPGILSVTSAISSLECKEAAAMLMLVILNMTLSLSRFFEQQGVCWLEGLDEQATQQLQTCFSSNQKFLNSDLQTIYCLQLNLLADKLDIMPESVTFFTPIHQLEKFLLVLDRSVAKMDAGEKKAWLDKLGETLREMTRLESKLSENYSYFYYNDTYVYSADYLAFRKNFPAIFFVLTERKAEFNIDDIKKALSGCSRNILETIQRFSSTIRDNTSSSSAVSNFFYLDTFSNFTTRSCSFAFVTELEYHTDIIPDEDERRKVLKSLASIYLCCEPVFTFPDERYEVPADLLFKKEITKEGEKQVIEIDLGTVTRAVVSNPAFSTSLTFVQLEDGGDWYEDFSATGDRKDIWVLAKRIKILVDTSSMDKEQHIIQVRRWPNCLAPLKVMMHYFFIRFDTHQTAYAKTISETTDLDTFGKLADNFFEIDDILMNGRWWYTYMGYMWKTLKKVNFNIEEAQFSRSLFYDKIYNFYKSVRYLVSYGDGKTYANGTFL